MIFQMLLSFRFFFFNPLNEEEENRKEFNMNVEMCYDYELRIRFSSDAEELAAIVKALKDLEEVMEKEAKLSKERLSTAITKYDENDPVSFRDFTDAIDEFKVKQENLSEIRNLIKCYSFENGMNA